MTNDLKDLVPAQEKLEWVTPKISLMVVTLGKPIKQKTEIKTPGGADDTTGPS